MTKPLPAYLRAQEAIEGMIEESGWQPGTKIPSERALAEQFGLSRMTVRQAVENLVRAGVLERDSTSGTRVAAPSVARGIDSRHVFSLSQQVRSAGARPGSRLLYFAQVAAGKAIAIRLGLDAGAAVIAIRRLRTANNAPVCVETSYLPAALVPGLCAADLTENASLYAVLEQRYGLRPTARRSEIGASPLDDADAELLGLPPRTNALVQRSVVLDQKGRAVEHVISVNHPERVVFSTEYKSLKP
jgi:GntR family transcriptional regulator